MSTAGTCCLAIKMYFCVYWSKSHCSQGLLWPIPASHVFIFALQSQEMLTNLESASVRIVKPRLHPSSSAARTALSSLPPAQQQHLSQAGAAPTANSSSSSTPALGQSCGLTPDSAGGQRMATIQEDISDSHLGEEGLSDGYPTAGACSSATKSSYEDLIDQTQPSRERRRLKRQECIDTKETECWGRPRCTGVRVWKLLHYFVTKHRKENILTRRWKDHIVSIIGRSRKLSAKCGCRCSPYGWSSIHIVPL